MWGGFLLQVWCSRPCIRICYGQCLLQEHLFANDEDTYAWNVLQGTWTVSVYIFFLHEDLLCKLSLEDSTLVQHIPNLRPLYRNNVKYPILNTRNKSKLCVTSDLGSHSSVEGVSLAHIHTNCIQRHFIIENARQNWVTIYRSNRL